MTIVCVCGIIIEVWFYYTGEGEYYSRWLMMTDIINK